MFEKLKYNINNFIERRSKPIQGYYATYLQGYNSQLGKDSTTFCCIDLICNAFANLSGDVYTTETKDILKAHPLKELIDNPNADETKFQFFYNSAKDYFEGNIFWYLYDMEGEIVSLFRISPDKVRVDRDQTTNRKIFLYNGNTYDSSKILHIPSRFSYDGLVGHSIFDECKTIFDNASSLDKYVSNVFDNSVGKRIVIDVSQGMPDITNEQIDLLKTKFVKDNAGVKNAGNPIVKRKGVDYQTIDTGLADNRSQQLAENREFQEREIAKILGVPIPLLSGEGQGDMEMLYTLLIENAVRPLATQIEQSINKILPYTERSDVYFEYSYNSLMKVSIQNRIDTYTKQINNGILNVNEVRRKENLSEIEAGDTNFIPANLMPLTKDNVEAYMAKSKETLIEAEHNDIIGDDKL